MPRAGQPQQVAGTLGIALLVCIALGLFVAVAAQPAAAGSQASLDQHTSQQIGVPDSPTDAISDAVDTAVDIVSSGGGSLPDSSGGSSDDSGGSDSSDDSSEDQQQQDSFEEEEQQEEEEEDSGRDLDDVEPDAYGDAQGNPTQIPIPPGYDRPCSWQPATSSAGSSYDPDDVQTPIVHTEGWFFTTQLSCRAFIIDEMAAQCNAIGRPICIPNRREYVQDRLLDYCDYDQVEQQVSEDEARQVCREDAHQMVEEIQHTAKSGTIPWIWRDPVAWGLFEAGNIMFTVGQTIEDNEQLIFGLPAPGEPDQPSSWMDFGGASEEWQGAMTVYGGLTIAFMLVLVYKIPRLLDLKGSTNQSKYRRSVQTHILATVAVLGGPMLLPVWAHGTNAIALGLKPNTAEFIGAPTGQLAASGVTAIFMLILLILQVWAAIMAFFAIILVWVGGYVMYAIWPAFWILIILGPWTGHGATLGLTTFISLPLLKISQALLFRVVNELGFAEGDSVIAAIATVLTLYIIFVRFPGSIARKVVPQTVSQAQHINTIQRARDKARSVSDKAKKGYYGAKKGYSGAKKGISKARNYSGGSSSSSSGASGSSGRSLSGGNGSSSSGSTSSLGARSRRRDRQRRRRN